MNSPSPTKYSSAYRRAVGLLESVEPRGMKPGLERTLALLDALGNPHAALRGVLVGGTNGKGSVCATVDSVARAAGLRSVMLTKPHLRSYCERVVVDGAPVAEEDFASLVDTVWGAAESLPSHVQPTAFEMLTAAGLLFAQRSDPDLVICEVGLGGRLDSTNVVDLGVAAVTNVGLDHVDRLGGTLEAIAAEKAAIIKPGDRAVTGALPPALEVIRARAAAVGVALHEVQPGGGRSEGLAGVAVETLFDGAPLSVRAPLVGDFQVDNVGVAAAVCDALRAMGLDLDAGAVSRGCASVRWPGRMQWISLRPPVLVDGAHNPPGIGALVRAATSLLEHRRRVVVFAAMRDKDVPAMVDGLRPLHADAVVVTAPAVPRSAPPEALARLFGDTTTVAASTREALSRAASLAGDDGAVVVCGSLYLAGEALDALQPD
jgi:dihydrofolate synthase/folylpolyglutamate synthase